MATSKAQAEAKGQEAAIRDVTVQCPYCLNSTSIVPAPDYRPIYACCTVCGKRFIAERIRSGIEVMKVEAASCLDNPDRREIELSQADEE